MRRLRAWLVRFGDLFGKRQRDRELSAELASHLELHIADNLRAGIPPEEARRQALIQLGGLEQTKEIYRDRRGFPALESFIQNIRYGLRQLRRSPGFTTVAILTLALGIGGNVAMFSAVDALLFQLPAQIRAPNQLVRVDVKGGDDDIESYPGYQRLSQNSPELELAAEASSRQLDFERGSNARPVTAAYVSHTYFHLLGVKLLAGRAFTAEEDSPPAGAPVVVLSYPFWKHEFGGDPKMMGRTILMSGRQWMVIGIAPKGFTGEGLEKVDAWLPLCDFPPFQPGENMLSSRGSRWLAVLGRPRNGLSRVAAQAEATNIYRHSGGAPDASVQLQPLFDTRTRASSPTARISLWLAGVAFIVLLIACANVASLLLARMAQRRHELAVRQQLGATRGRLIRQIFVENLLLGSLGAAAALLLAFLIHPLVQAFLLPKGFNESRFLGWPMIELTVAFTALAAIASGIPPAMRLSRPGLIGELKSGEPGYTREASGLRWGLLVVQVALTLMLSVGAGLLIRSLRDVRAIDLGYQPDGVLLATMDLSSAGYTSADTDAIYKAMLARVVGIRGVEHAAAATTDPFLGDNFFIVRTPATLTSPQHVTGAQFDAVTPDYFSAMGMKILRGRSFSAGDIAGSPSVIIINETLAHELWPGGSALNHCLMFGQSKLCARVIGIVPDTKRQSLIGFRGETTEETYIPLAQSEQQGNNFAADALIIRTASASPALAHTIFGALESAAPGSRFVDIKPLSELHDRETRTWRLGATMFTLFGALALTLAAVGIYGVLAFLVRQRTAEIGVRMTLGALPLDIFKLVVWHGMKFVGLGIAIGIAAALALTKLLNNLLYGVSASDPTTFVAVSILLVVIALAACYIPARRAARVDPMVALRYE